MSDIETRLDWIMLASHTSPLNQAITNQRLKKTYIYFPNKAKIENDISWPWLEISFAVM